MGARKGTVTRPSNGARVAWRDAPILLSIGDDLDRLGIVWYDIGNGDHLKRSGGHTPWKPGAPFGMVTAIDIMKSNYAEMEARILRVMRSSFDTTWIDFINVNGNQYDFDGRWQDRSGDYHLHLETLGNRTAGTSTLWRQMYPEKFPSTPPPPAKPAPTTTSTFKGVDMAYKLVKVRSRDDVWKAEGGKLYHLTPAQFKVAQAGILADLPPDTPQAAKDKAISVFTVEGEAELATFGTEIVPTTVQVVGFDAD